MPAYQAELITALNPRYGLQEPTVPAPSTTIVTPRGSIVQTFRTSTTATIAPILPLSSAIRPAYHPPSARRVSGAATASAPTNPTPMDVYSRHVELSRRIQHQQMTAMLGLTLAPELDTTGLDIDSMFSNNALSPSPPSRRNTASPTLIPSPTRRGIPPIPPFSSPTRPTATSQNRPQHTGIRDFPLRELAPSPIDTLQQAQQQARTAQLDAYQAQQQAQQQALQESRDRVAILSRWPDRSDSDVTTERWSQL